MAKKKNKRDDFYSMIPGSANKILDVGCNEGSWVNRSGKKDIEVVGMERDERSYAVACKNLRKVFLADVEKFDLPYPDGYFDSIIYADILEHLIDPYTLLKKHKKSLNDGGCIIASIPNVRYYKIINGLALTGVWDYMENGGLLDKTHLRFFTLLNIKELFLNAGFEIVEIKRNIVASSSLKFLNFLCFNKLKEFLVYQYYIKAIKQKDKGFVYHSNRRTLQF